MHVVSPPWVQTTLVLSHLGKAASHSAWSSARKVSLPLADGLELVDFEVSSSTNHCMIYSRLLHCMKQVVCYKLACFLISSTFFLYP